MKYDFTSIINRQGWDAIAVDALGMGGAAPAKPRDGFDAIPMWVADMNFPVPPSIQRSIIERVTHPAFGYFSLRDEYYSAVINWQKRRNGVDVTPDCIGYENGVLGGVISALNVLCTRGGSVLLHSPTYIGFTGAIESNGYRIVHSSLYRDEEGIWRMDYADMERKIAENGIHAVIFCSPHNPCGRVWEKEEIRRAMEIFERHQVTVISDEIWSDLIMAGHRHIPTQSVSEYAKYNTIAFYAPSKTFNLAGLVGSYHIIYDKRLRALVRREGSLSHYNSPNVLSMYAHLGAYSDEGEEWLDELCFVLGENLRYVYDFIHTRLDGVTCAMTEGTYMLFIDCDGWCKTHDKTIEDVERAAWSVGVALQDGRMFHGPCHLRMNVALPKARVEEAMARLEKYVFI